MSGLFLFCRAGFENECAAEMQDKAGALGIAGYAKTKPKSGYVIFNTYQAEDADSLLRSIAFDELVFTRQWFVILSMRNDLPVTDRISVILESLADVPECAKAFYLQTPDTNEGKELSGLCRALEKPMAKALQDAQKLKHSEKHSLVIHICFLSTSAAYIGYAFEDNSSPWPMGIPRLKFPSQAPSRSTLKLDEAILFFLSEEERKQILRRGMRAVDLGASPGGWTWQLVRREMHVIAVDNGAMAQNLLDTGLVEHQRVDGFKYEPDKPVDWLVCDIVEQPIRIADLIARWFGNGWCTYSIFNLKLPMKKRYLEIKRCEEHIAKLLADAGISYYLSMKQLYHDREEVTVFIARIA